MNHRRTAFSRCGSADRSSCGKQTPEVFPREPCSSLGHARHAASKGQNPPGPSPLAAVTSRQGQEAGAACSHATPAPMSSGRVKSRQPFRRRPRLRKDAVPGTTRKHANGAPTALRSPRPARAGSYSGHTPPLRFFKHPEDLSPGTGYHAGNHSGSQVSAGLRTNGHVARGELPPGLAPYVPGSPRT